mmetsp:Transcript_3983/g.6266  ORF Transcript_3983/g.6266 Transcript_3983/m.6266 type:complete len:144 (-) Transcript_3983:377-808(-)
MLLALKALVIYCTHERTKAIAVLFIDRVPQGQKFLGHFNVAFLNGAKEREFLREAVRCPFRDEKQGKIVVVVLGGSTDCCLPLFGLLIQRHLGRNQKLDGLPTTVFSCSHQRAPLNTVFIEGSKVSATVLEFFQKWPVPFSRS